MPDKLAPGCFGSPVAFDPKLDVCASCPFNLDCGSTADAAFDDHARELESLDERLNTTFAKRFRQQGRTGKRLLDTVFKAVDAETVALAKIGVTKRETPDEGNPFRGKVPYLDLALVVARAKKGVRRQQIAKLMLTKFTDWNEAQAHSKASVAVETLKRLGYVTETNGMVYAA